MTDTKDSRDGRYHRDVYWPTFIVVPHVLKLEGLYATHHVRERAAERAASIGEIPKNLYPAGEDVIECTIENGVYTAILFRVPCKQSEYEAVYVVNPTNRRILTVFLNRKNDHHKGLDLSVYTTDPNA